MSVNFLRNGSIAALTLFSAQSAWADVTGKDVWTDWQAYIEGTGYKVTATETQSGDTLTVSDITLSVEIPEEDVSVNVVFPTLSLRDMGDGSVNAAFPAASTIGFNVEGGPKPASGEFTMRTDGTPVVVTGDSDDMTYVYNSDTLELAFKSLTVGDETLEPGLISALVKLSGLKSTTHMKLGALRSYNQTYDIENLSYDFHIEDPDNSDSKGIMKAAFEDLKFTGNSILPLEFDVSNLKTMLDAGTVFNGIFTFGAGQSEFSFDENGDNFLLNSSSQGGTFDIAVSGKELKYDLLQKGTEISTVSSELPFPVSFSAAEIGLKIQGPPTVTEEDQDMSVGLTLREFNVPEELWGLVDPAGILPHDPASLVIDLSGKGRLLVDILDPEVLEKAETAGESPALVNSVKVNELLLRAAGAELTGTGAFELDYNDMESFDGIPAPLGVANLSLVGANGLIDNLIKMGLISDSDATGARLMMGLLAVPGEGDDSLVSEVEFGAGGQISANGQRLK